jgi:hypothetical protein
LGPTGPTGPAGPAGPTTILFGQIDVVFPAHYDEYDGVVTGLPSTPIKVIGQVLFEESVTVQSGMVWLFNAYKLNSNGFNYRIVVINNEFWPGPGSITLKVDYIWSTT